MKQTNIFGELGHAVMLIKLTSSALQQQSIGIIQPATLKTIVSLTTFLLMVIPLKLVLIIVSEKYNWIIYGSYISKQSMLTFIALIYIFLIALYFVSQNYLLKIKIAQSLTYDGIPKYELNDSLAETKTLSLFNNLTTFYSSVYLFITYTVICSIISLSTIIILIILGLFYGLVISRRIRVQITDNSSFNSIFRICTTIALILYILIYFPNSSVILALLLFLSGRQWCTQVTQIGNVLSVFNKRLDLPLEVYRFVQNTEKKEFLSHRKLPAYFCKQSQFRVFENIYERIADTSLGHPFKIVFIQTHQASLNCFSVSLKTKSGSNRNDLFLLYSNTEYFLKESLVLNCVRGSRYCPTYHKISNTNINGFLLKDIQTKLTSSQYTEILPDLLFELWRIDPEQNTNMLSSGHLFTRYFRQSYFQLLKSVTTSDYEIGMIQKLEDSYTELIEKLNTLPKTLFHPFLSNKLMFRNKNHPKLIAWGYSSIEPIGSQLYTIKNRKILSIENILNKLRTHRKDFQHVTPTDLEIASLCYEIAQNHKLTLYSDAKCAAVSLSKIFYPNISEG